jgi:hypothetical protein
MVVSMDDLESIRLDVVRQIITSRRLCSCRNFFYRIFSPFSSSSRVESSPLVSRPRQVHSLYSETALLGRVSSRGLKKKI